jgi:hypothetical protein
MLLYFNTVPKDFHLALRLVSQIRRHFPPQTEILAIPDGCSSEFAALNPDCLIHDNTRRLKAPGTVHLHCRRNIEAVLELTSAEVAIQVDPDLYISRAPRNVPDTDWFGQWFTCRFSDGYHSILHGACWGAKRGYLRRLLDEQALKREYFLHPGNHRFDGSGLRDRGFAAAVSSCPGSYTYWEEVKITRGRVNINPSRAHFASHPNRSKG